MKKTLYFRYINEQGQDVPFVVNDEQIIVSEFRHDAKRMGAAPTLTFNLYHSQDLESYWKESVYVEYRSEKYFLSKTPTSSFSNEDTRYVYNITMVSERAALDAVYFYDVVGEDYEGDIQATNSSVVTFFGTVKQFAERLNYSLQYANLQTKNENGEWEGYKVFVDVSEETESKLLAFNNQFISEVLQEIYKTFNIPYYFKGKEIHIGFESEEISEEFEYGIDGALLSITKSNSNNAIINRCTGVGSKENIPYYYPNDTPLGDVEVTFTGVHSAKIADGSKFTSEGLLGRTLTYSKLKGSAEKLVQSYGVTHLGYGDVDSKVPLQSLENQKLGERTLGAYVIIDTSKDNFSGKRYIDIRISVDIEQVYGDAVLVEKYKDEVNIQPWNSYLSIDGRLPQIYPYDVSLSDANNKQHGVHINRFEIEAGHTYKLTSYLNSFIPQVVYNGNRIDANEVFTYDLDVWYEVTSKENDSFIVGEGWTNEEGEVQSLSEIGVSTKGEPTIGDTITFTLLGRYPNQGVLMPSIFRESGGNERFYNAINGEYDGYEFPHPYIEGKPKEYIAEFEDIKPTITGMTNVDGQPIDHFIDFAYDVNDSDETEEIEDELVYKHPYIFAKLPKLGFNLFDHAIENGEMTISMTSGHSGACKFKIVVAESPNGRKVNTVQVDENGNLVYDENGNVLCGRNHYQGGVDLVESQQDTTETEVWIALEKDDETYGKLMPLPTMRPTIEDTFVITNISLPKEFILQAEKRLETAILDYLLDNNQEKFNFSIAFSRIYLQEHPDVLAKLTENAKIKIRYNNRTYIQYVSSLSCNVDETPIPEITVNLTEELSVRENPISRAISEVSATFSRMLTNMDVASACIPYFLRKDQEDVAYEKITFRKGVEFGNYSQGIYGSGGAVEVDNNGNSFAEFDYLNIRKKATFTEITIQELKNIGGSLVLSPAAMKCSRVVTIDNGNYRCYFEAIDADGNKIGNEFAIGDLARCQTFNLDYNRYYWRKVVEVGEDYIDLSATEYDSSVKNDIPLAGDTITTLGNDIDVERQAAIVLSAYGENTPSMTQYANISDFNLENKVVTKFSKDENVITGKMTILPNSTGASNIEDLKIGGFNILRNSGFTGNYVAKSLFEDVVLDANTEMYSDPLEYWNTGGVSISVQDSIISQSGKEIVIRFGGISQQFEKTLVNGDAYVLSFRAKGSGSLKWSLSDEGVQTEVALNSEYKSYHFEYVAQYSENRLYIEANDAIICDIQLEKGVIPTSWHNNYKDNRSDLAYYSSLEYLASAIKDGSTTVDGGLVLTNIINVGNYVDNKMKEVTGGISGVRNDNNDVAFWAGGSMSKAIKTAQLYKNDASYQPTEEELAAMAKFVVTHGGRAILNDIILRGYVYAQGGVFKGQVQAGSLVSGIFYKTLTEITPSNRNQFGYYNSTTNQYLIDIEKTGPMFSVNFPCTIDITKEYNEDLIPFIGNTILVQLRRGGMNNMTIPVVYIKGLFISKSWVTEYDDNNYITNEVITVEEKTINVDGMFSAECTFVTTHEGDKKIAWEIK